jgi:hypothetical protein
MIQAVHAQSILPILQSQMSAKIPLDKWDLRGSTMLSLTIVSVTVLSGFGGMETVPVLESNVHPTPAMNSSNASPVTTNGV